MPFKESNRVEERIALMRDYDTGMFTVTELCGRYGITRETFYVWQRRRMSGQKDWWQERSRAPASCPHATPSDQVDAIIAVRRRFVHFGPKKIAAVLARERSDVTWPSASTIGDILKREGLVEARPHRRRRLPQDDIVAGSDVANGEWSIDFKGWFRTADNTRCDPLTIADTATRFLIDVRITAEKLDDVRTALERVFRAYGLPDAVRSDNGPPFGSPGPLGLSRLSVWLMKLHVEPRHIPPASPQHNGRHERMHKTLKAETATPPAETWVEQQLRFNRFRRHFNEERPHEALGQTPPAQHWQPSARAFPKTLAEPWYDADHQVRRVRRDGTIKWRGELIFLSEVVAREWVGLAEIDDGRHAVRFMDATLGAIDRSGRFRSFAPPYARLCYATEPAAKVETKQE